MRTTKFKCLLTCCVILEIVPCSMGQKLSQNISSPRGTLGMGDQTPVISLGMLNLTDNNDLQNAFGLLLNSLVCA